MHIIIKYNIFILIICISSAISWNFSKVNLPDDIPIWRFAIWKNRAFLAIPRWENQSNNSVTLLEAPWIEPEVRFLMNIPPPPVHAFPNLKTQSLNGNCSNIISVTGLDIDSRGRLWILDAPTTVNCPAKIIVFDLLRKVEVKRATLTGVATQELKTLIVDPMSSICGHRGYIGDPGDESIIVYNLGRTGHQKWWRLHLVQQSSIGRSCYTSDLAISRKNSRLYFTGNHSLDLFSIDLEKLRNEKSLLFPRKIKESRNASVTWHGTKMGVSSGLLCDSKDGLHYFLMSEFASVRWDTKYDLKAASHAILLQSEQVLSVTDYRMDSQKNVWGLVNAQSFYKQNDSDNATKKSTPTSRVIQILHNYSFKP